MSDGDRPKGLHRGDKENLRPPRVVPAVSWSRCLWRRSPPEPVPRHPNLIFAENILPRERRRSRRQNTENADRWLRVSPSVIFQVHHSTSRSAPKVQRERSNYLVKSTGSNRRSTHCSQL